MRCQIEKNKEILCDEIEKLGNEKMSETNAAKLSAYRGAYKALCMLDKEEAEEWSAGPYEALHMGRKGENRQNKSFEHQIGGYEAGFGASKGIHSIDKITAIRWTERMENEDGTIGPHWTMEQTKQVQSQKDIDCDSVHFWIAMNMVYSDYSKVAKKFNVSNTDFYASMAEAFLEDKDAQADKLERYYQFIVKH